MTWLWIVTAYVANSSDAVFADGTPARWSSECVVAAPKQVPFGTKFYVHFKEGVRVCVVKDRIGSPRDEHHLDVFMGSRQSAIEFGVQELTVLPYKKP